jgi:inner membrane protein
VVQLRWFTRGWYAASKPGRAIAITDLRMGAEPNYVFRFAVALAANPHPVPTSDEQLPSNLEWRQLRWVWQRIWTPRPAASQNRSVAFRNPASEWSSASTVR